MKSQKFDDGSIPAELIFIIIKYLIASWTLITSEKHFGQFLLSQ